MNIKPCRSTNVHDFLNVNKIRDILNVSFQLIGTYLSC